MADQQVQSVSTVSTRFLAYAPIVLSLVAMLLSVYTRGSDRSAEQTAAYNKFHEEFTVVRYQVDTLLATVARSAFQAGEIMHRPEVKFARRDELLVKWGQHQLSGDEKLELLGTMQEVFEDKAQPDAQRGYAGLIVQAMKQQAADQPGEPKSTRKPQ